MSRKGQLLEANFFHISTIRINGCRFGGGETIISCKAFEAVNSILRILVGKTDNNDCNEKCYAEN